MAAQLPGLNPIERLSLRVIRILGGNPGKVLTAPSIRLYVTNLDQVHDPRY